MPKQAKPRDPDRLVRQEAGTYLTEDGRFSVHSEGAARWYLTDTERHHELGLEVVLGPFETLAEVREAIAAQRADPAGVSGPLPEVEPRTPLRGARQVRPHDPPTGPAGHGRTDGAGRDRDDGEKDEPAKPATRIARPRIRVGRARWRKQGDERDAVAACLQRINDAWVTGDPGDMLPALHPDVVFVAPGFAEQSEGADAAVDSYRAFLAEAIVRAYVERGLRIDLVGDTAVASYAYQIEYRRKDKDELDRGHDLWVVARHDGRWVAVWRTLLPSPGERR
jgi:uncharacterized protein (TIGR02246 family)